jgi:hypothetical protein
VVATASTISLADDIVVMEGGRIVDRGGTKSSGALPYAEIAEFGCEDVVFLQKDTEAEVAVAVRLRRSNGSLDTDPVTEADPETQRSEVAAGARIRPISRGPGGTLLMLRDIWRLLRGEDQRARKVRWMLGLLRPYRRQVVLMMIALVIAAAVGSPPASPAPRWAGIKAFDERALTVIVLSTSPRCPCCG